MDNPTKSKKTNRLAILLTAGVVVLIMVVASSGNESTSDTTITNNSQIKKQTQTSGIYRTSEKNMELSIDDSQKYEIRILDIYYALARLTDSETMKHPFYAMKNPDGEGYIGISSTPTGKAVFLVPYIALNQTNQIELRSSIKAINGTAKTFDNNLQFASGYDALEMITLAESQ